MADRSIQPVFQPSFEFLDSDALMLRRALDAACSTNELVAQTKAEIAKSKALMAEIDRILALR